MTEGIRRQRLGWLAEGTSYLTGTLDRVPDGELAADSALPGWTRAHLVTHLARNADALVNLLTWARTGVPTPMYRDADQRAGDIQAGAGRPAAQLREDYRSSAERLDRAIAELAEQAWAAEVRTARGRPIPAAEVPWMRVREVWVHAVDLAAGARFEDFPPDLLAALIDDAVYWVGRADGCPAVLARAADLGREWRFGQAGPETVVDRPAAELAAWVTGRGHGEPELPPWL